jgi:hypothetical protein
MNPTEQELLKKLIDTFSAWNKDLQNARNEFQASIHTIEKARLMIEKQKKSPAQIGLEYAPWAIMVLVVVLLTVLILTFHCGTFTYQQLSYTRPC